MRDEVNYYCIKSLPYIYLMMYICMYNNIYTIIAGIYVCVSRTCITTTRRRRFSRRRKSFRTWIFREVKLIAARVNLGNVDQSITRVNIENVDSCIVWLRKSANYLFVQNRVIYVCLPITSKCVKGKVARVPFEISDECVITLIGIRSCNYIELFVNLYKCALTTWRIIS